MNVSETYNRIATWFAANRDQALSERKYLDKLINLAGRNADVLDLGCGTGLPIMNYLLEKGMNVIGVDASEAMLNIARKNLPDAVLLHEDMRSLVLDRKFDVIIAWHSFFHLPSADQPAMFEVFEQHLQPGGLLVFTSGKEEGESWGMNGGENLFHASLHTAQYRELLGMHHFQVLEYNPDDAECGYATVWLAQHQPK
jgi:2-polyprenyl-3-methyl-5-hydroxy-6-metoxy-1,4-benzoquinol methylase